MAFLWHLFFVVSLKESRDQWMHYTAKPYRRYTLTNSHGPIWKAKQILRVMYASPLASWPGIVDAQGYTSGNESWMRPEKIVRFIGGIIHKQQNNTSISDPHFARQYISAVWTLLRTNCFHSLSFLLSVKYNKRNRCKQIKLTFDDHV